MMIIDMKGAILELKDYVLDHISLAFLLILVGVAVGLLYPESQLLRTYSYFNLRNIGFSVVTMDANFIAIYSFISIILKLLGKDPDEILNICL